MTHFAVELRRLADTMTLNALAEASGVPRTSLSNYTSMRARPSPRHLRAICEAVAEPERARLVIAHLMDERPESASHLVDISPRSRAPKTKLPREGPALLAEIERMMLADPEFTQWLSVTLSMLRN